MKPEGNCKLWHAPYLLHIPLSLSTESSVWLAASEGSRINTKPHSSGRCCNYGFKSTRVKFQYHVNALNACIVISVVPAERRKDILSWFLSRANVRVWKDGETEEVSQPTLKPLFTKRYWWHANEVTQSISDEQSAAWNDPSQAVPWCAIIKPFKILFIG